MIFYLARKYATTLLSMTLLLGFFPVFLGQPITEVLPSAMFWGSLFASFYVYRKFVGLRIWPLYDNLRLSGHWLLGAVTGTSLVLSRLIAGIL